MSGFWRFAQPAYVMTAQNGSSDLEGQENVLGWPGEGVSDSNAAIRGITATLIPDAYQWMDISVRAGLKEPLFDLSVRTRLKKKTHTKTKNKKKKKKKGKGWWIVSSRPFWCVVVVVVVERMGWGCWVTQSEWVGRKREREREREVK